MQQLSTASGTNFDRMFRRMMIGYHQGVIFHAQHEQSGGVNEQAKDLAAQIVAAQTQEIGRMQQMLQSL